MPRTSIEVAQVSLDDIHGLREVYRREMACQIAHDSWHARGFTTSYLFRVDGQVTGYGAVGGAPGEPRITVKEFFVLPPFRGSALPLFRALVALSGARRIEAQTNDVLLSLMLHDCAVQLRSEIVLFSDGRTTTHSPPGVSFRPVTDADRKTIFPHTVEPVGDWGLEYQHELVATGGLLFHYNPPFGDLYMEVAGPYQQRGFGTYLVQELKRLCHQMGRVPAARCHQDNHASRRTLERAGMFPCARIVYGHIGAGRPDGPTAKDGVEERSGP